MKVTQAQKGVDSYLVPAEWGKPEAVYLVPIDEAVRYKGRKLWELVRLYSQYTVQFRVIPNFIILPPDGEHLTERAFRKLKLQSPPTKNYALMVQVEVAKSN